MHIAVYIFASLYIVLALGLVYTYFRERHTGTLLMAAAYGASAALAVANMHWWPILTGFVVVWMVRFMGLDPSVPRHPR